MALINCPECGKELSDKAISCPKCAFPIRAEKAVRVETTEDSVLTRNRGCADIIIGAPLLFLVVIFILFFILRAC